MEVLYLKSQGIKHKDICSLCKISKITLPGFLTSEKKTLG
ncbi:hypothetical protein RintRC_5376 [Richelia intracellularis]|nr:hypothetical protein RintRC_5376 [Richelia intracellularis]